MRDDEKKLWNAVRDAHGGPHHGGRRQFVLADEIGERHGIPTKRVHYLLEKWSGKGWWESGVTARTGWFTPDGWAQGSRR